MINFTDRRNLEMLIKIEKSSLSSSMDIQKSLNKQILTFFKNFISKIEITNTLDLNSNATQYINSSTQALEKSNNNLTNLDALIKELNVLSEKYDSMIGLELEKAIRTYNANFNSQIHTIFENTTLIQQFIFDISLANTAEIIESTKIAAEEATQENITDNTTVTTTELKDSFLENTLVISEISKKVILPFDLQTVTDIFVNNKDTYSSIEDVIAKKYTLPISYYKYPAISRFKEAYKLVIEREKGSKHKAFSLAYEMLTNFNLHPAIITACNSLDELDIYLACLYDNDLNDFKYFKVKYEIPLAVSRAKHSAECI